jgi:hypothetical protein
MGGNSRTNREPLDQVPCDPPSGDVPMLVYAKEHRGLIGMRDMSAVSCVGP